jgi:hypothetical protein
VLMWTKKGVTVLEVLEVTITGLGALKLCKGATAKKPTCMDPEQKAITYNRRDSQMVTHSSTNAEDKGAGRTRARDSAILHQIGAF